jgi:aminopeptidase I
MLGQENKETQMVPIIGLDNDSSSSTTDEFANLTLGSPSSFAATQPPKLLHTIATALSLSSPSTIINWELELYDTQPAQTGGLDREFIFGGRIDDKVCSWAAIEALLAASSPGATSPDSSIIQLAAVFDDEEIGSLLRQGARSNFLPSTIERVVESFASSSKGEAANLLAQSHASSFLISADVTHAVNPNFLSAYLSSHSPRLNVGLCIACDSNGHMTTDAISTSVLTRIAEKHGDTLQLFQIRNDLRSGGTIGPALSTMMGVRAVDAGVAQLSMHSVRATIGDKDPGLAVGAFEGFFGGFEGVDAEFE